MTDSNISFIEYEVTDASPLPLEHFLSLQRPDSSTKLPAGVPDTSTLAAHDFDLDNRTGFLPPEPPLGRLPAFWEPWESLLDVGKNGALQLGSRLNNDDPKSKFSESWRESVEKIPVLSIDGLKSSETMLRRAHHVLAGLTHLFLHSLPEHVRLIIPEPIGIPLLQVSQELRIPPVLTYSDTVLYNWDLICPSLNALPSLDNLRCQSLWTGTRDEEVFYLASTKIELRGAEALEIMRTALDEIFVGDELAIQRVTEHLRSLASVIRELKTLLLGLRDGCNPDVFYNEIRLWLRGADPEGRPWEFEALEKYPQLAYPEKLAGSSAGQSALIHALDIFLGMENASNGAQDSHVVSSRSNLSLLEEMRNYMPRHHRHFLSHLESNPRRLRDMVLNAHRPGLQDAYNTAISAMKEFRDAHLIIVTLYIIVPARKTGAAPGEESPPTNPLKGTGGTDIVDFLKGVRSRTTRAILP